MREVRIADELDLFIDRFLQERGFHDFDTTQAPASVDGFADEVPLGLVSGLEAVSEGRE